MIETRAKELIVEKDITSRHGVVSALRAEFSKYTNLTRKACEDIADALGMEYVVKNNRGYWV